MRMISLLLMLGIGIALVAVVACRPRDDTGNDTTRNVGPDSAADTASDTLGAAQDTTRGAEVSAALRRRSEPTQSEPTQSEPAQVRKTPTDSADSTAASDDSIRAMRPRMPQVTPGRPGQWRGLRLPEERRADKLGNAVQKVERPSDSVVKGDSTKRPPR